MPDELEWHLREAWRLIEASKARNRQARDEMRRTLKIIADNPWLGTGLGTFGFGFPAYRSDDIPMQGLWGVAHSTPLEFASEMGLPLTLVVTLAWIVALIVLSLAMLRRPPCISASAFASVRPRPAPAA